MYSANQKSLSAKAPCDATYCRHELLTGVPPSETACIVCLGNRHWNHKTEVQSSPSGYATGMSFSSLKNSRASLCDLS